ncbi:MAG TPA: hypothetical protein VND96_03565 [Candidatus Micrarchaeaceae archaeon]|nr:hypothetical protein [Candidatus Micrarchaeaceae archaeon]
MTTELDQIADSAGETATTVAEVAFGAAQTVREVASDPMGTARKQVKGLERKGTPAARKVNRRFNARLNAATAPAKDVAKNINARLSAAAQVASDLMPERITVLGVEVNGRLPEKVVIRGFELVKLQARRRDVVGSVAKRSLRIFNGSFKTIAKTASRLEYATELRHAPTVKKSVATRASTRTRRVRKIAARRRAA